MGKFSKWVLTLGMMAAAPTMATAGDFDFLNKQSTQPTASRSNQEVAEDIGIALKGAKLNGFDIEIQYQRGVATLNGKIQDARQKAKATKVLSRVAGVQRVNNQLQIIEQKTAMKSSRFGRNRNNIQQTAGSQDQSVVSNQKMAQKVASALTKSGLNGYDIEVRFQDGRAQLGGMVGSPQEAKQAYIVASNVDGVHQVMNSLRVKPAPGARQPSPQMQAQMRSQMQAPAPGFPRQGAPRPGINQASFQGSPQMMPIAPQGQQPPAAAGGVYNSPNLPNHAWPAQAAYPNYAAIQYPKEYSASAWPYIGPFYPYPQVPMGWREVSLEWDDGYWKLDFDSKTDRWYWFMNPKNW